MVLTDWFDGSIKPVHIGVYQTYDADQDTEFYNYFDGKDWHWGNLNSNEAVLSKNDVMPDRKVAKWRGVTNNVDTIKARIKTLSEEITANEEENEAMQAEIDKLYEILDKEEA